MTNKRRKKIKAMRKERNRNRFSKWFNKLSAWKRAVLTVVLFLWVGKLKKGGKIALGIVSVLLIAVLGVYLWGMGKISKLDRDKDFDRTKIVINDSVAENVGIGYTNFVLFGGDSRQGDVERNLNTDSIIIVSLNNKTKEVKMVSVYRDTLLDVSNGSIRKCNSAYAAGGPEQAINMLNMNLDLNIQQYVTVDFGAVSDVIDMLGGIEIDVSEKEYREVNKYIGETAMVAKKKAHHLTHGGLQTLDGVQATTYARIRKNVGDDYARTERQRLVIQKAAEKAMQADFATLSKIIDVVFPKISTNLTNEEILKYAKDVKKYKIGETSGFPFEKGSGNVSGRGSSVFPITLKKNVTMLHEFLFGTKDYQPSSKVVSISGAIASVVGKRDVEPNNSWKDDGKTTTTDQDSTTDKPKDPAETTDPTNPDENPDNPDNPDNPKPDDPNNPGTDDPGTDDPDSPGTENPDQPDDPGTDDPNNPITPSTPETPADPITGNTQ